MDLIVGRKTSGIAVGKILFNGKPGGDSSSNSSCSVAYVQSTDVQIGEFTVMQSLYFAAQLRLGGGLMGQACEQHCREVATSVGLESVLHTIIGTPLIKGISGGQLRRLTIATELLASPTVLCLDEPTTGEYKD
jgi:ABC-type multidrug transport system ATPase subunit